MAIYRKLGVAVAGLMAATAVPAHAVIIDLELPTQLAGPTYTQDGFTLRSTGNGTSAYGNWIRLGNAGNNANGTNATIFQNNQNTSNVLTKADGTAFSFSGISLADVYNNGGGGNVDFLFTYFDGTTSAQSVTVDNLPGLQAFTFNQNNLRSVTFTPTTTQGPWVQFDFLVVDQTSGAVPEPATWAMMMLGFGGMGYAMRRRRKAEARVRFA